VRISLKPQALAAILFFPITLASVTNLFAESATNEPMRTVIIRAEVPPETDTVYVTGNRPEIGNWFPRALALRGTGAVRAVELRLPQGTSLEYKFTLGSWEREGLAASGMTGPNNRLLVTNHMEVSVAVPAFKKDVNECLDDWRGSGVLGRLEYWRRVPSRHLATLRNVSIWLPPGYEESTNHYPVLYMHDGQNLFDPRLSYTGVDWGVDEAIMRGVKAGKFPPMIVIGAWSTEQRLREYSPWNGGTNYARFLIEELMPQINQKFRTLTNAENTSVMGSSMGGLISFWLVWSRPDVFGKAGCLSSALPWDSRLLGQDGEGQHSFTEFLDTNPPFPRGAKIYFDYGTRETSLPSFEQLHLKTRDWLLAQGLSEGKMFVVRKFPDANHSETAWRMRLDEPLEFLFGKGDSEKAAK
jgi:predicted alpha/beta superfamily hydrolase